MKFGQLIEYNMRNIFLENSHAKYGGETSLRPFFSKIKIEHIFRSTVWNFVQSVFIVCLSRGLSTYTKIKVPTFSSYKAVKKEAGD